MPDVRIIENGFEQVITVDDEPIHVGRDESNDIVLSEQRASRRHCVLEVCPQGIRVRDLGSANGTVVNGQRIQQKVLRSGDEVLVGGVTMRLEASAPMVRTAPPVRRRGARGGAYLLAPAILLIVGLLALTAVSSDRDDEIAGAREALARLELDSALSEADPARLAKGLDGFVLHHPSSRWTPRAREHLSRVRETLAHNAKAADGYAALTARESTYSSDELRFEYQKLLRRYRDVPGFEATIQSRLNEITQRILAETARDLTEVIEQVGQALAREDYGGAEGVLNRFYFRHVRLAAATKETADAEMDRVRMRARGAYGALELQVDALRADERLEEAKALLREAMGRYTGTRYGTLAQLKYRSLRAIHREARPADTPVAAAKAHETKRRRENVYLRAQEAEELARAGLYERALACYRQIVAGVRDPGITREFNGRITDISRIMGLLTRLRETARDDPGKFADVRLGSLRGRVVGADHEVLRLESRGATLTRKWADMAVQDIAALVRGLPLKPDDLVSLAIYQFDRNDRDGWVDTLIEAMEHAELKETIDAIFARKEGIDVPDGGFVSHRGRILTQAACLRERSEEDISTLLNRFANALDRLDAQANFKLVAKMRKKRIALDEARKYALALIFNTTEYFYPYRARMAEYVPVQREVDARVAAVAKIWNDPNRIALRTTPETLSILETCREVTQELEAKYSYDVSPLRRAMSRRRLYLPEAPVVMTVREFPLNEADRDRIAYDARVLEYNEKLGGKAEPTEIQQVRITNEYRIMLARPALVRDDRLVMAARGHSKEMAKEGYFGHFSPHPERRSPMHRVKLEGYTGMPVGENCHKGSGSPLGAHNGWCHSSGHHRNLLSLSHTDMGTGRSGRLWTQNFGRTKPLEE